MAAAVSRIHIGTAGWSIPSAVANSFPGNGKHLERYARVLNCAEINSSFYRPHALETYQRWAASTPTDFRFSVKLPRTITHDNRLSGVKQLLRQFLAEISGLEGKLGALLVQLPPSLIFTSRTARVFFSHLRALYEGAVVLEPRHLSWFADGPDALLGEFRIARVAADPAITPRAKSPGGWSPGANTKKMPRSAVYYRLHGSPRMYWSSYSPLQIAAWAEEARQSNASDVWFIFDNTAGGAAIANAMDLRGHIEQYAALTQSRSGRHYASRALPATKLKTTGSSANKRIPKKR